MSPRNPVLSWTATRPSPIYPIGPHLTGIMCLIFAAGPGHQDWLKRVTSSQWYRLLRPQSHDLRAEEQFEGQLATGQTSTLPNLPKAGLISVAILAGADDEDFVAVVDVVRALSAMVDHAERPVRIVVTVSNALVAAGTILAELRDLGAFVIWGARNVTEEHLHFFPVGTVTIPQTGQLIGVDLGDYLECWTPSGIGRLETIPFALPNATAALDRVAAAAPTSAANLNFILDSGAPETTLAAIDHFATMCREALFAPGSGRLVFTNRSRLDGQFGTVDLLAIG